MSTGAELIAAERRRQIDTEGWTPDHDRHHMDGALVDAAICYLDPPGGGALPSLWPWGYRFWKPTPDDRVRELVKAGALIAAEIDRLGATTTQTSAEARWFNCTEPGCNCSGQPVAGSSTEEPAPTQCNHTVECYCWLPAGHSKVHRYVARAAARAVPEPTVQLGALEPQSQRFGEQPADDVAAGSALGLGDGVDLGDGIGIQSDGEQLSGHDGSVTQ